MVRYNPDVVKNHSSQSVPMVFLGKHTFKTQGNPPSMETASQFLINILASAGLFNMGIPHITHIKLLWGKKKIKYGLNMIFH